MRAARVGLRLLAPAAPGLAAAYAERLFLTAPRHHRPAWEAKLLTSAEPFQIPHDGSFLPAWRWGRGPSTVLLVHGWEGRGSQLGAFVKPLLERGLSVVAFDAPGHGDAPSRFASVVTHGRAVHAAGAYLGPLHAVIGHSVGGAAALYATRLGFRADRLVLVSPPTSPRGFASGFAKVLDLPRNVQTRMLARLEVRYGVSIDELDVRSDAASFRSPVLVVHDVEDRVVPFDSGVALADLAPRGRLVSTTGLGHNRILRAPEMLGAVVPFVADGARTYASSSLDDQLFRRDLRW